MRKHEALSSDQEGNSKRLLRESLRAQRHERFVEESWMHILEIPELAAAPAIASYISYGDEPQTGDLNLAIIESGRRLYLPRMNEDRDLSWVQWNGDSNQLKQSGRILEPTGDAAGPEEIAEISVVIVPTLHVDREGVRLGQGGGSYDRALPKLKAWRIGLVHYGEITSDPLPRQDHDQRLDAAATPDLLVRFH